METILIELRRLIVQFRDRFTLADTQFRYMALPQHKKLAQPVEGSTYT